MVRTIRAGRLAWAAEAPGEARALGRPGSQGRTMACPAEAQVPAKGPAKVPGKVPGKLSKALVELGKLSRDPMNPGKLVRSMVCQGVLRGAAAPGAANRTTRGRGTLGTLEGTRKAQTMSVLSRAMVLQLLETNTPDRTRVLVLHLEELARATAALKAPTGV